MKNVLRYITLAAVLSYCVFNGVFAWLFWSLKVNTNRADFYYHHFLGEHLDLIPGALLLIVPVSLVLIDMKLRYKIILGLIYIANVIISIWIEDKFMSSLAFH